MKSKKILAIFATAIMLVSVLSAISIVKAEKNINDEVKMEQGTTDRFGGGDYVVIKPTAQNKDWVFGVLYGTADNPNGIVLFAGQTRYIGGAEIYENGEFLTKRGIPIYTLFVQKFVWMIEFDDINKENYFDMNEPLKGVQQGITAKPVKGINLTKAWTINWINNGTTAENNTYKTWVFSLTVENLEYKKAWDYRNDVFGDDKLNKLEFTFYLTANLRDVEVPNVPWYRVDVKIDRDGKKINNVEIQNSSFIETRNYTGTAVDAKFKYDHLIEGWDFASNDSKLVLETHAIYGKAIRSEVADWAKEQFMRNMKEKMETKKDKMKDRIKEKIKNFRENATVEYDTENATGTIDEQNIKDKYDAKDKTKLLIPPQKRGQLTFDDNWYRVGAFRWVSNVSVTNDGQTNHTKPVFFQIHGGMKIGMWNNIGERGDKFYEVKGNIPDKIKNKIKEVGLDKDKLNGYYFHGFAVKGAFIYPQGEKIFHDPEFDSSAVSFDIENEDAQAKGAKLFFFLQLVIAIVVISLLIAFILLRMRKK